ncbi:TIR domain-containing protein [Alicyclobacillus suci]|uniref:TIR domain-containing protein n=1 Tax=Alicyclobacillus suci TaxID=2816080 RepID=UPI001A903AE7|nr:TIR domain-containing protein [Alicyclobacillus suci]
MARRVYFAFHYEDVKKFRVNVVRNSWLTKEDRKSAGYFDASLWEKTKKEGDLAIKRMINSGLANTSVTAVLAGTETYARPWVRYEILKSFERSNGLFTVFIHKILDKDQKPAKKGPNPLDYFYFRIKGNKIELWEYEQKEWTHQKNIALDSVNYKFGTLKEGQFSKLFKSYDWKDDNGYNKFPKWVELAAANAGK